MKGKKLMGIFDWSPLEEFAPIWLTDRLVVIYSDRCEKRISKNAIPIKINRSFTFGTGGHPSTRGAVHAIIYAVRQKYVDPSNATFVDLGDTSGLMSIIANHMGFNPVYLAAEEEKTQDEAEANIMLNDCAAMITEPSTLFGVAQYHRETNQVFDVRPEIICTIQGGSPMVRQYLSDCYDLLVDGGVLIWAGHQPKATGKTRAALEEYFDDIEHLICDGWPVAICRKTKLKEPKENE
jgi:ribosomal protein L11 methylase PrmA